MGQPDLTRRAFLTGSSRPQRLAVRPPGLSELSPGSCDGCDACARACPAGIIALDEGLPVLDFRAGACTFCGACAAHCPKALYVTAPVERLPQAVAIGNRCLALNRVDCQSCRDACPVEAIRFRPRLGGPFIPVLDPESCTGCGACIAVCPADAVTVTPRKEELADA